MQLIKIFLISISLNYLNQNKLEDKFFAEDKLKHFSVCFFLTSIIYQECKYELKIREKNSIYLGITIPLSLGIAKEIYDKKSYGLFSFKDILWDIGGIISATFLIIFY